MTRLSQLLLNARCCVLDLADHNWRKLRFHFRGLIRAIS